MLVICVGLKRAASTLQYQICKELLSIDFSIMDYGFTSKEKDLKNSLININNYDCSIIKTHNYFNIIKDYSEHSNVLILSSYRDLRESSVSQMVAYNKTYSQLINRRWLQNEISTFYKLKDIRNILMQDYSSLKTNLRSSIIEISEYINIKLSDNQLNRILNDYTIESQQKKIDNYTKSNKYKIINLFNNISNKILPSSLLQAGTILNIDKSTSLHYNHINKKELDWQKFYTLEQKEKIKSIIGDWLIDVGYEKDKNW